MSVSTTVVRTAEPNCRKVEAIEQTKNSAKVGRVALMKDPDYVKSLPVAKVHRFTLGGVWFER